jgi:hypothetical protein
MGLLTQVLRLGGLTHGGPPCSFLPSRGELVPMVPNLVSSPQVLDKQALVLIIQTFLFWRRFRVLYFVYNNWSSAKQVWLSAKQL